MSDNIFEKLTSEGPVDGNKLLNEDEILTEEDKKKPEKSVDCNKESASQNKPKKPCANCTCGLAEEIEKEATAKNTSETSNKGSCGSCYLGDAFRCGSCPYRGMPAFKPGEKVTIDTTSDDY